MKDTGWYKRDQLLALLILQGTVVIPIEYTNSLTRRELMDVWEYKKMLLGFMWILKGQIVSDKYDRIGNFHQGYASVCLN